jgi:hypothetical protein
MPEAHVHKMLAEVHAEIVSAAPTERATVTMKSGGNYSYEYIGEGTLMNLVRPKLAERGVSVVVNGEITHASPDGKLVQVVVRVTFTSSEDGSTATASMPGMAADMGDKALAKALTSATRYCLWKTFLVPSEDPAANEAGTSTSYEPAPPPPAEDTAKMAALSQELEQTVKHLAARKGRTPDVALLLEQNRGALGVHPDFLQKLIDRLDQQPDQPFAGSEAAPKPSQGSLLATPPAPQPVAGGGVSDAQKDELAQLVVQLSDLDRERDWHMIILTKVGEMFGKKAVNDLTSVEAQQLIELAEATKLELRGA